MFVCVSEKPKQKQEEEQDPQASQKPPVNKRELPLICNRHFYNIPVNTNYSAVHVPSNVYERCKSVSFSPDTSIISVSL